MLSLLIGLLLLIGVLQLVGAVFVRGRRVALLRTAAACLLSALILAVLLVAHLG